MFPDYNLILSKQGVGKVTSKQDFGGRKVGGEEFSPSGIIPHLMLVVLICCKREMALASPLSVWGFVCLFYPESLDSRPGAIFTNL